MTDAGGAAITRISPACASDTGSAVRRTCNFHGRSGGCHGTDSVPLEKRNVGAYFMKRVTAGAHLQIPSPAGVGLATFSMTDIFRARQ